MNRDLLKEISRKGGQSGKKREFTQEERAKGGKAAQFNENTTVNRFTPDVATRINLEKRWKKLKDDFQAEPPAQDTDSTSV